MADNAGLSDAQLSKPISLQRGWLRPVLAILFVLTAVRIAIMASGAVDLSGDEAHYWEWSRRLDWCYYSKPPGVAYLIRAGTSLFGHTNLGVRCMAAVLSFLSSLAMYGLGRRLAGPKVGAVSAVLLQVLPLYSAFGIGLTPDAPLIFFSILSLYLLHRAWSVGRPADWLLLACALGLGLLCKYAIIFLSVPAWLLLFATTEGRRRLRTPWPYICFPLSFIFFVPVLIWNSRHDWVTFRHDIGHTKLGEGMGLSFRSLLDFVGGQLGVVTPIVAVLMLYLLIARRRRNPFCFWMTIPILAGFLLKSVQGKVQPNWPLVGWLAGIVPLADLLVHRYRLLTVNGKRLVTAGLVIPAVGTLFLHVPFLAMSIPWPEKANPLEKLIGWKQLGTEVTALSQGMQRPLFLFSDHYMVASELAFYVQGRPTTYCINLGRRMNQYDIWPGFGELRGYDAIYVTKNTMPPGLAQAFASVQAHPVNIEDRFGRTVKTFTTYLCRDFKGWKTRPPAQY